MKFSYNLFAMIWGLGLLDVIRVFIYKTSIRLNIHPACRIKAPVVKGPYFSEPLAEPINADPVSAWQDSGMLFEKISINTTNSIPNWLQNPLISSSSSENYKHWWKINDFEKANGDIKLIWEQSRMHWLIAFAQRARNGDSHYLKKMNSWLDDWMEVNPPYFGPNWKCGQEASIRVMNICIALIILDQYKNPSSSLLKIVELHMHRISSTMSYAIGQRNNHGTSEAAALFLGGSLLVKSGNLNAAKWEIKGRKWIERLLKKLVSSDGSFSQHSINYHRMLVDTVSLVEIWRTRNDLNEFSENFYEQVEKACSWLFQMISSDDGDVPNLGTNDGTRLIQISDINYRDFRPSLQLAMAVFKKEIPFTRDELNDENLKWLGLNPEKVKAQKKESKIFKDGGYALLRKGGATLLLRVPIFKFRPSQCDGLHLDLWLHNKNCLIDAGTYSYNDKEEVMDYFSGNEGHNVVVFDERNQMPKISRFLYGNWLKGKCDNVLQVDDEAISFSAFCEDYQGAKHHRKITLYDTKLVIDDQVSGFNRSAKVRWRLGASNWKLFKESGKVIITDSEHTLSIRSKSESFRGKLTSGWKSLNYLSKEKVSILEGEINENGSFITEYFWNL